MSEMNVTEMRDRLKPKGTAPLIRINETGFYDESFIVECLDEMERKLVTAQLDPPSKLEIFAMQVLLETAKKS